MAVFGEFNNTLHLQYIDRQILTKHNIYSYLCGTEFLNFFQNK